MRQAWAELQLRTRIGDTRNRIWGTHARMGRGEGGEEARVSAAAGGDEEVVREDVTLTESSTDGYGGYGCYGYDEP